MRNLPKNEVFEDKEKTLLSVIFLVSKYLNWLHKNMVQNQIKEIRKSAKYIQSAFACSKLTIGTIEQGVKYVQS